jgi:hypothetical protein
LLSRKWCETLGVFAWVLTEKGTNRDWKGVDEWTSGRVGEWEVEARERESSEHAPTSRRTNTIKIVLGKYHKPSVPILVRNTIFATTASRASRKTHQCFWGH